MILTAAWSGSPLSRVEREAIGAAQALADGLGRRLAIVTMSESAPDAADEIGRLGAARIIALEGALANEGSESYLENVATVAAELSATAILLPGDELGLELAPRLASRLGGTAITHVVSVELRDGQPIWTRPTFGGKALATVAALREPIVCALRPGAFSAAVEREGATVVERRQARESGAGVHLVERRTRAESGPPLEAARVVVSGGRGLGGPEGFSMLEEIACLLGGTVGASLGAVEQGWVGAERQVGLTGKLVRPDLYFAVGISGASQHLAGVGANAAIVAVNSDPDAPIFEAARLGVVMDYREFLPALADEVQRRLTSGA